MKKSDYYFILSSFLLWRIFLILIAITAIDNIPVFSPNFFGGGYNLYRTNPLFWGHVNFDGEHFLSISQSGYKPVEYFFFPLFPKLISLLTINNAQKMFALTGILISNVSFLIALVGLYKIVQIDFKDRIAKLTVVLMLLFPTSFYFGVFYSESLFLALVVWIFYFARKNKFIFASIIAALASATRVIGFIMLPVILFEYLLQKQKDFRLISLIAVSPLGLILYMHYLFQKTGDPVIFVHQVQVFGEQRSQDLILLPQVLYRYFFKIIPNISYTFFPNVFTTYLELLVSIIFFGIILFSIRKIRISYFIYALMAYLIPTLAGSFSSMPRYLIVVFPVFIYLAILISKIRPVYRYLLFSFMGIMLIVATALFWRGYWVS